MQTPPVGLHTVAFYPGSFDPLTNGHMNIIQRGLRVFDRVIVAMAQNINKKPMFTLDERRALVQECFHDEPRVTVVQFDGLMVEAARSHGASAVLRGLRGVADFESEFQMATMNNVLEPALETVFMMTEKSHFFVSSHLVREVASLGGDISPLVPAPVYRELQARLKRPR